ncbi:aldo/keto reductase [Nocardioides caldifontis]|uniref:aldo/keto reductase n=1 Tax=Nocardioides caldifontis TaxID=2588938 RepID=UPI001939433B|nr:aldo/keto reductase [Nocardioides caldifontis]
MTDLHLPDDVATFASGAQMPLLGFGTWQITGDDATRSTAAALSAGYRHIDTAHVYGNEGEIGQALRSAGVPREELFLTTKCPPHKAESCLAVLEESLSLLGVDHVDLWLIHWPADSAGADVEMWRRFVEARDSGLTRDIGVSNFPISLVDEVTAATGEKPSVNQVEWSPLLFDSSVLSEHRSRDIVLEGYSALRGGTLDHPVIGEIASSHGRTPAQVIIRWHLQHGVVVIPKSTKEERIRSNADVADFSLSDAEMAAIDALGRA